MFPLFYQSSDTEARIIENLSTDDTAIIVDDASGMSTGNHWIKNELVNVFDITDNGSDWTLLCTRGKNRTFRQQYIINEKTDQHYYIRRYAKTFIGQRVFLYEDTKLLSIGIINEQPTFDQALLSFECENAISTRLWA